jgi:transposase InsO family protein
VSDITYIRTRSGLLYLAVVLDLYARKVVGGAMAPTMHAELVCAALQLAITQRQPAPGLIVHADRGSWLLRAITRLGLQGLLAPLFGLLVTLATVLAMAAGATKTGASRFACVAG